MLSRIKKAVGHAVASVEDAVGASDADPAVSAMMALQTDRLNTCSMSTSVCVCAGKRCSMTCDVHRAVVHTTDYSETIAQPLSDVA